jgi:hypothetical protein
MACTFCLGAHLAGQIDHLSFGGAALLGLLEASPGCVSAKGFGVLSGGHARVSTHARLQVV